MNIIEIVIHYVVDNEKIRKHVRTSLATEKHGQISGTGSPR